jgi:diguanylate cyclase (GGDEF)-like protein
MRWWNFATRRWSYIGAVAAAVGTSGCLIAVLFLSLSRIESALPNFGFFAIREFHIAIRDVTHLRDMVTAARLAPQSQEALDELRTATDLVYIRFERIDGGDTISAIPAYGGIVPEVSEAISDLDEIISKGLPIDAAAMAEAGTRLDDLVGRMNDEYYKYGAQVNADLFEAEKNLSAFNYQISLALAILSLLAIGTAVLLIARRDTVKQLKFLALNDAATGLKNRAWLSDNRDRILTLAKARSRKLRLFLIDLDNFKAVNDTFGHHIGDLLLKRAADVLLAVERSEEVFAVRLGGDEFAVLALDKGDSGERLAQRLLNGLNGFAELDGHRVKTGASIGMACFPEHGDNLTALMRHADLALYSVKSSGRAGLAAFSPTLMEQLEAKSGKDADLKRGLKGNEFFLVWQPQFELGTGRVSGVEALVRWRDSSSGRVLEPAAFLPLAEESGLVVDLDRLVLEAACAQAAGWTAVSPDDFFCAVNISTSTLQSSGFVDSLSEILQRTGMRPERLRLEITEGNFTQSGTIATDNLDKIRRLGIGVALDDFGAGHSGLGYLAELHLTCLKIDRSLIAGLESSPKKQGVVEGILAMAKTLELRVVAEGVETPEQLAFLIEHDCHGAQGFLMSEPMEEKRLTEYLLAANRGPKQANTLAIRKRAGVRARS